MSVKTMAYLADMQVRLETARLSLYKVAWLKKEVKPIHKEAAMAKLYSVRSLSNRARMQFAFMVAMGIARYRRV